MLKNKKIYIKHKKTIQMKKANIINKLVELKTKALSKQLILPKSVKIFEVGPRDGLQNEPQILPLDFKLKMINGLKKSGLKNIEIGAFVSPRAIPSMADTETLISFLDFTQNCNFSALVPNIKGFEKALQTKIPEVAVFTAVSESFCQNNINCSIDESIERFEPILKMAKEKQVRVRGYISCVLGCPYEGAVDIKKVNDLTNLLLKMGCYEVSLGDTIGKGVPESTAKLLDAITASKELVALHFHDTYGNALENILIGIEKGFSIVDSSVGGLGGCPYARKVVGNVCTENVVQMMDYLGIDTGVDIKMLMEVSKEVRSLLNRNVEYLFD